MYKDLYHVYEYCKNVSGEFRKTTTTVATPEKKLEQPVTTKVSGTNGTYEFKVVEGPRPDKKGKKKYPMNMR